MRRFTASAVASTIATGAASAICWSAVNCAAPAITSTESPMTSASASPASLAITPKSTANGTITSRKGAASKAPCTVGDLLWRRVMAGLRVCTWTGRRKRGEMQLNDAQRAGPVSRAQR